MAKKGRKPKGEQKDLQPQLDLGDLEEPDQAQAEAAPKGEAKTKAKTKGKAAKSEAPTPEAPEAEPESPKVEAAPEAGEEKDGHSGNGVARDDSGNVEPVGEGEGAEAQIEGANGGEPPVEETGPKLTRLVNTKDGCWKELDDGSRIDLSEDEWRSELARNFGRGAGAD